MLDVADVADVADVDLVCVRKPTCRLLHLGVLIRKFSLQLTLDFG